jgi:hypothetical protein
MIALVRYNKMRGLEDALDLLLAALVEMPPAALLALAALYALSLACACLLLRDGSRLPPGRYRRALRRLLVGCALGAALLCAAPLRWLLPVKAALLLWFGAVAAEQADGALRWQVGVLTGTAALAVGFPRLLAVVA